MAQPIEGGCHCGAVRFRVRIDERRAIDCNCSICRKKGFLHLIVEADQFELLTGHACLATYTFNTHQAKHHFCAICGVNPFYIPRSHPHAVDVNLRCLDPDVAHTFEITPFDGHKWEENVDAIR